MKNRQLSMKELSSFCTQLALLLKAGITPYASISLMMEDTTSKADLELLSKISDELNNGENLSDALKATNFFPAYLTDLLALGEETGSIDITLENLASYYERMDYIKESIKNSLVYPAIMVIVMFIMILVLFTSILPTIDKVYEQLGNNLTGFSKLLFSMSDVLQSVSAIVYFAFCLLILFIFIKFKNYGQGNLSSFPKYLSEDISCCQFATCLTLVTSSGIDLDKGLNLISKVISGNEFTKKISDTIKYLNEDGDYLYDALRKAKVFNPIELRMLEIGYKTGNPDIVLNKIAKNYEDSFINHIQRRLAAVEPTLVIVFCFIVGLVLISSLLPLIGIMANIG